MSSFPGQPLDALDSPQLLLDLDVVDANLRTLQDACRQRRIELRVHFKSLKCGSLARYLQARGVTRFLAAKLNEAEVLADAGVADILVANQIVGPAKLERLAKLAGRARVTVCVDDADNVHALGAAAHAAGTTLGVLIEVDVGMKRCGVEPGPAALELARHIQAQRGLRFAGLQGYEGHLQLLPPGAEKEAQSIACARQLVATRRLIEEAGIPVGLVTGAGTGTWQAFSSVEGVTEIQPGSFLLMDCAYHVVRPEFGCALSILSTVISRRPGWYVLDAGSKAISKDFGMPLIQSRPEERVSKLSEEHTRVEVDREPPPIGERRRVIPAHCCATMNLHRQCIAVRGDRVEAVWPIEASGRYD
jgi:D-serine deaminase-like pyridoxal phosphate-dependent protein